MGGPWNWSKGLRDQELFDEHAQFLDGLVDEGYIVLGGPLDERDVLLVVQSETVASVRSRFAADSWIENGMLTITAVSSMDDLPRGAALGREHRPTPTCGASSATRASGSFAMARIFAMHSLLA